MGGYLPATDSVPISQGGTKTIRFGGCYWPWVEVCSGGGGILLDEDAYNLETTDAKRLSRLHWEDILRVQQGEKIVAYFRKDAAVIHDVFEDYPKIAAKLQRQANVAGEEVKLNGSTFYVLRATMFTANFHLAAVSGQMTWAQLRKHFTDKDGFVIQFDATDKKLTFSWMEVIDYADSVYFFGAPVEGVRNYARLFRST